MKKHFILIVLLVLLSCAKDEEKVEFKYSPIIGEYKILSLNSDIALDLNRDGIPTKNYINELNSYFNLYEQYNIPFLKIFKSTDNLANAFFDDIPKQFVNATDVNDIFYGKAGPIKTLNFNNDFSQVIAIDGYYQNDYYREEKWAILKYVLIIDNNNISATFEQQYFTIETGWKTCILKALFTRKV